MTAKEQLAAVVKTLRTSADLYRDRANRQDRQACYVDCLTEVSEEEAASALVVLMKMYPAWFPS